MRSFGVPHNPLAGKCLFSGGLVGAVGIEPTTFGLKGHCSTTELRPYEGIFDFSVCAENEQPAFPSGFAAHFSLLLGQI